MPAAECETLTLFLNSQNTTVMRIKTKELGHPQPETLRRVDNATTNNHIINILQQKKSNSFDMQLHCLRDQINNSQFKMDRKKREFNHACYYFKRHIVVHPKKMCPKHLVSHAKTHHKMVGCFTPR